MNAEEKEKMVARILAKLTKALRSARSFSWINPQRIEELNSQAIDSMMKGNTADALEFFLLGLELSSNDPELQASCLINIGDYVRRIVGSAKLALEIFDQVADMPVGLLTDSRLQSMRAMVYMLPTETGQIDPEGVKENIRLLNRATKLARLAQENDPKKGLEAESFALHRLAGTVCNYGSPQEQADLLPLIDAFIPRLPPGSQEVARLNYSKAVIIAAEQPKKAIALLVESAERMHQDSPLDACSYWVRAGLIAFAQGLMAQAEAYLENAQALQPLLQTHVNSEPDQKIIRELATKLGKK